jgi:hypothetical protein
MRGIHRARRARAPSAFERARQANTSQAIAAPLALAGAACCPCTRRGGWAGWRRPWGVGCAGYPAVAGYTRRGRLMLHSRVSSHDSTSQLVAAEG